MTDDDDSGIGSSGGANEDDDGGWGGMDLEQVSVSFGFHYRNGNLNVKI